MCRYNPETGDVVVGRVTEVREIHPSYDKNFHKKRRNCLVGAVHHNLIIIYVWSLWALFYDMLEK